MDDMIITESDEEEISRLKDDPSVLFEMNNLGEVECFLDLKVEKISHEYFICQRKHAKNLLKHLGMEEAKEMTIPIEMNLKMKKTEGKLLKDARSFRQLDPRTPHLEAAKRILCYIKGSVDYDFMYEKGDDFMLQGFTEAD
ncbi:uncharacterized protein LOC107860673 [Capsicum annuum]|uniref:uncharacterized protein LOC107860673 n=1 Tax=Capsicum annuum TaxID=4072 RepID=UPI0007BF573F|nr:uncharacterized protein LOC107860673 [Capsicum annuum]